MWRRFLCILTAATVITLATGSAWAAIGDVWELQPIDGNNGSGWGAAPNWEWGDGNPMTDNTGDQAVTWEVAVQDKLNPLLTDAYTPMVQGYYVNYYRVWKFGSYDYDPQHQYRSSSRQPKLIARNDTSDPQNGPSSAILFEVSQAGRYQFDVAGTVQVANKSAGYLKLTLYTLSADRSVGHELTTYDLNTTGGYHSYPDSFTYSGQTNLGAGEEFAVRIQAINPGNASAGNTSVTFSDFKITQVPVPEPGSLALLGLGGLVIFKRKRR